MSGGLDSAVMAAGVAEVAGDREVHTFTAGYGVDDPEVVNAATVARVGVATGVVLAIAVNYVVGAAMSLRMLGATWREYAASQLPAFGLGLLTAAVAYPTRLGLLAAGAGQLLVLVLTGCVSLGVLGALYVLRPSVIRTYGGTAVRHVGEAIGSRFFPPEAT